jgi:hypothetical protein
MYVTCWKEIGSLSLIESQNTLKEFNGTIFKPYDVLPSLSITLEGKAVIVEVEVFDAPPDYKLLLGRSWIYSMCPVVSTLFHVICFPHQGKFVTVDQLAFFNSDSHTSNVPFIVKTPPSYENVSVGLLKDSLLMGMFPIPPLDIPTPFFASINMISIVVGEIPESYDPWIVPNSDGCLRYERQNAFKSGRIGLPSYSFDNSFSSFSLRYIFGSFSRSLSHRLNDYYNHVYGIYPMGRWGSSFYFLPGTRDYK